MKLLFVDCCISQRGEGSRTRRLAEAFLAHAGDADVERVDVAALGLPPYDAAALNDRDAQSRAGAFDGPHFALARQFHDADRIVVAAPFWDLSFPAVLRTYIEHIAVNGVNYHYDAQGPHGDCRAKQLVYLTTGGDFERENSLGVLYWQQLCAMFGIPQFDYVFAGGLDAVPEQAETVLSQACDRAARLAETF